MPSMTTSTLTKRTADNTFVIRAIARLGEQEAILDDLRSIIYSLGLRGDRRDADDGLLLMLPKSVESALRKTIALDRKYGTGICDTEKEDA